MAIDVPFEGNGKSLCSLRIRISDALKWLADRGDSTIERYCPSEGPSALQDSRLSTPPPSQTTSRFPGHPSP